MDTKMLGHVRALVTRDLVDAAHNRTVLMSCAASVLLALLIGQVVANASRLDAAEGAAFTATAVIAIAPAFTGCVVALYVMAEEWERGTHLTLAEAGVTPGQIAVAKWLAALIMTLAVQGITCALLGFALVDTALLLAVSGLAVQPLLLGGLACGLIARDQMASNLLAVPLTLVAVAPVLSFVSDAIRGASWFLPLGPVAEALRAVQGISPAAPSGVLIGIVAGWISAALVLVAWACRRFSHDLARKRDRLD